MVVDDEEAATVATGGLQVAVGLGFVTARAVARWCRPANRTGTLSAVAGFLWFGGTLTAANDAWLFSAGFLLGLGVVGGLVHLLLAFPTGRLRTRCRRALVVTVYGLGFGPRSPSS